ncbi:MAG: anhydro-N-acetylmuramic acid kinase [Candidatus Bathyarchaeota archaeon]|nr:anhydro-N-acetylmuramic acid kinase [Candidatus Bathyarchaeota archaeon]
MARTRLEGISRKAARRVAGLISGTSADGVSAAVTEITGTSLGAGLRVLGFGTYSYPPELKEAVFELFHPETSTVDRICEMNFVLGEFFAECALRVIGECGLTPGEVDLIGSHGQTIHHLPGLKEVSGYSTRSTLQIGEAAVIAERTGIPTVADFRKADIAAGGEGAPLTPYLDLVLHRHPNRSRVLQNIGGIANLTYLPPGATADDVVAFDTGPGNMVIDAVVRHHTSRAREYDEDGRAAAKGEADAGLLGELLSHPYFARSPPKTTGREEFGEAFALDLIRRAGERGLGFEDTVATATALTVESIAGAYELLLPEGSKVDEVYVSGGGARNRFLMGALAERLDPTPVLEYDALGYPGEAKEAMLMALLASEHVMGTPANVPRATGARRAVVLGALYPAQ